MKLLAALQAEKDCGASLLDCRPLSAIQADLKLSNLDLRKATEFLLSKNAIKGAQRSGEQFAMPTPEGTALLQTRKQSRIEAVKKAVMSTWKVIAAVIALIVLVLGGLVSLRKLQEKPPVVPAQASATALPQLSPTPTKANPESN